MLFASAGDRAHSVPGQNWRRAEERPRCELHMPLSSPGKTRSCNLILLEQWRTHGRLEIGTNSREQRVAEIDYCSRRDALGGPLTL